MTNTAEITKFGLPLYNIFNSLTKSLKAIFISTGPFGPEHRVLKNNLCGLNRKLGGRLRIAKKIGQTEYEDDL